jgi:hypothetical protein
MERRIESAMPCLPLPNRESKQPRIPSSYSTREILIAEESDRFYSSAKDVTEAGDGNSIEKTYGMAAD